MPDTALKTQFEQRKMSFTLLFTLSFFDSLQRLFYRLNSNK